MDNLAALPSATIFLGDLHGGGAERVALYVAEGLQEHGWRTEIVLTRMVGDYCNRIPPQVPLRLLNTKTSLGTLLGLISHLRKSPPDVLFSFLPRENALALLAKKATPSSIRFCTGEHITPSEIAKLSRWHHRLLYKLALRRLYPTTDCMVAVSHGISQDLAKLSGIDHGHIRTLYNPVVGPEISELASKPQAHPWFAPDSTPLILSVGRLEPEKDFFTLLDAFQEICRKSPCRLVILGEGRQRAKLEERIRKMGAEKIVHMPGFVQNPFAWMARADVFVISSVTEGLNNAIIEAMACGTAVVSTDCPNGPAEILEGGRFGPLVPIQSPKLLAEAIQLALKSPVDPATLRQRAADFAKIDRVRDYARIAEELCK